MSAYKTPPDGWVDLRSVAASPVTIATGLGLGLHSYSHDVGINDLIDPANTATIEPEGLLLANRGNTKTACLVHRAACSMALDPTLDVVFQFYDDSLSIGVASETVCDDAALVPATSNHGIGLGGTTLYIRFRGAVAGAGNHNCVAGEWYRYTMTNMLMQSVHTLTHLVSNDPGDWETGTQVATYTDTSSNMSGGNVCVPFVNLQAGVNRSYIAAVRMTPRRSA